MQYEEYRALAMRTSPEGHDRVLNGCLGLIGETGEVVDVIKKWRFQSGDDAAMPKQKIIDECGDVCWYCAELATGMGVALEAGTGFHPANKPIWCEAARLSRLAIAMFDTLYNGAGQRRENRAAQIQQGIRNMLHCVGGILEHYADVRLEDAMNNNIEKLRRRYPDGFDPERSLHRA